ncbi:urease accessory protein UreE [Sphingobacterium sp. DR205]|uniref:urease accessory protein UreE n=1 Tax=Sphingobacterium sp. DR205 TaxID=2713573 RepID=UPI0013E4D6A8|nr:urease accessory protein UreE [Sphingobacterium sp. DR205]QIH33027.1 urease accessory protein UreE [Sphingobacterium sp. DR205]
MNRLAVTIDTIVPQSQASIDQVDRVHIEWFEINKRRLTRNTLSGNTILMELERGQEWHHGDALYHNGELQAIVTVKPTLAIRFNPSDFFQLADFGYFVGNRHLPIFQVDQLESLRLPYDGRLYEQIAAKYGASVQLEEAILLSENRIHQQLKNRRNNEN